jgi:hypothetical protein
LSRSEELTLKSHFVAFSGIYVRTFSRSYGIRQCDPAMYGRNLIVYKKILTDGAPEIFKAAAAGINAYLNLYSVRAAKSADEYKIIYFLGLAIERQLQEMGYAELAQVHMFSMIGLLDYRLRTLGIDKPSLRIALTKLIKQGKFEEQLGRNGGYLIYKSISTTPSCMSAASTI